MILKGNPWKEDLERLSSQPRPDPEMLHKTIARLDELVRLTEQPAETKRKADGTTVKMKVWWGNTVATWNPTDAKNLTDEQKHPRLSKWFS